MAKKRKNEMLIFAESIGMALSLVKPLLEAGLPATEDGRIFLTVDSIEVSDNHNEQRDRLTGPCLDLAREYPQYDCIPGRRVCHPTGSLTWYNGVYWVMHAGKAAQELLAEAEQ